MKIYNFVWSYQLLEGHIKWPSIEWWDGGAWWAGGLVARAEKACLTKKVPKRYHPTASTLMVSWDGGQNTSKEIGNRK